MEMKDKNGKRVLRLSESDIRRIVRESIEELRYTINEVGDSEGGQETLGALHAKKVCKSFRKSHDVHGEGADDVYDYAEKQRKKAQNGKGDHTHDGYPDDEETPLKKAYNRGYNKQYNKEFKKGGLNEGFGEENPNATDPEWIKHVCKIVIDNNYNLYTIYNWLTKCVAKRNAKGQPVYVEHLAKSSSMSKLVGGAFRANNISMRRHPQEAMDVRIETAKRILSDAQQMASNQTAI